MASVFKRGRWVDESGRICRKGTPGAKRVKSDIWMIRILVDGKPMLVKGFSDKGATVAKANDLEKKKARGEVGLVDPFKMHRNRPLPDHVADWTDELRQLGRDDAYIRPCKARIERLAKECGWNRLGNITADSFCKWRETATDNAGNHRRKSNAGHVPKLMSSRSKNHYFEALRTFCRWCVKRHRIAYNPVAEVQKVDQTTDVRRQRRALTEDEVTSLLAVVPSVHQLTYRMILSTGLRRDELKQLQWADVKLNAPMPHIQLRAETTKAKRADVLPLRADLVELLAAHRGEAGDDDRVIRAMPTMNVHRGYLAKAGIAYVDDRKRRADFHALRHTYGSLLAKAGIAPRVAMSLMRHTDLRLTMNVYTDPRIFDMAGAVEKLTALAPQAPAVVATGTDDNNPAQSARTVCVTSPSAVIGVCSAPIGTQHQPGEQSLSAANGSDWQQKTPSGWDGETEPKMGVEPTTPALRKRCSAIELLRR